MSRLPAFRRTFTRSGAPPGTLERPEIIVEPRLRVIRYHAGGLEEFEPKSAKEVAGLLAADQVVWLDVQGLGDGTPVAEIGAVLGFHHLAISDVVNLGQRPKVEEYDDGKLLFFVVQMLMLSPEGDCDWDQFSLFLRQGLVVTFQAEYGDCLDPVRIRLREGRNRIREAGADYLACQLMDAVVDGYFPVLEELGDRLEEQEFAILERPTREMLGNVYRTRHDLMFLRRNTWPLREALSHLLREEEGVLSRSSRVYLRDTADHVMQVVDVIETYRELSSSLVDVYLSMVGNRTNEVMRVLTVIATIFIPLTFLAGVYGMNFNTEQPGNMPELNWPYAYVVFWLICIASASALLLLFRRLGWLGRK